MDTISQPGWSSIRPWIPPLTLSVKEITSVSVTFLLSAATSDSHLDSDLSLAAFGLSTDDIHEDEDEDDLDTNDDEDTSNSETDVKKTPSIVSSALAGGLSVEVDRASWRRVFIKIDDKADEAVIIVYALMPGRQYDIDLELVQGGESNSIRHQVTTEETENKDVSLTSNSDSNASLNPSTYTDSGNPSITATSPISSTPPQGTPSSSGNSTSTTYQSPSPSPGYGFAPLTLEDRLTQLQHTLSLLDNEQMTLTTTIKTSRRDAQKADAALRSEIETLKRASEKYAASELRAKQKVLALQEAAKQAQIATKEIHATVEEVEGELPGLKREKEQKEKEYQDIKGQAQKISEEREKEEEKERKRIDEMKNELAGLGKQVDKLEAKKEKLDVGTVKDLEDELTRIEDEIERLQDEETFGSYEGIANGGTYPTPTWGALDEPFGSSGPGAIGRPPPQPAAVLPVQRTAVQPNAMTNSTQPWIPAATNTSPRSNSNNHHSHGHSHAHGYGLHNNQHNQRASSLSAAFNSNNHHHPHHHHNHTHSHHSRHHQPTVPTPTTILTNPNRQSSLKSTTSTGSGGSSKAQNDAGLATSGVPSPKNNAVFSPSGMTGPLGATNPSTPVSGSTLSSRAPPFEPGRGILQRSGSRSKARASS
ncbi:hypothetical protein K435DRAFT_788866 [Dendrothele bispora CBS 962.96]|uniref:Uncharacterized protein n=1 Tax=Dendrothele bispora (strain CBS 962.96) TaxID=1314807 RepID=A0A4S8MVE1_DENBC|nr:hypothetical protein K435DRAFT_788866 [Dendrothele bispora CBS 962.96]